MRYTIYLALLTLIFTSCDESTITERFNRVETHELILTDQNGKSYNLIVDQEGNVKAMEVSE
ncbi:MAG: hypothetical protein H6600_04380 [Flavobacteriales bacterium]|nr:hypothetical protein [Flavobacteriales bacterium]